MITTQVESFRRVRPELETIFPVHWDDLALFKDRMPLAPQYEEYELRDDCGELLLMTVRVDGDIAAYYTVQIRPGFHYSTTLTAVMDLMYVLPKYKNRGLSRPLLAHIEAELRRRGVQLWYSGYKTHKPQGMDRLYALLGFQPADTYCAKWIGP